MTVQILKETPQHLIIHTEDGRVDTVINDSYTKLKYGQYEGNRIFYKEFGDGIDIAETYDERIFNCTYNGETIQVRDTHSNELSDIITQESKLLYIELYKSIYFEKHKTELLDIISKSNKKGLRIPPGINAELGYIFLLQEQDTCQGELRHRAKDRRNICSRYI